MGNYVSNAKKYPEAKNNKISLSPKCGIWVQAHATFALGEKSAPKSRCSEDI